MKLSVLALCALTLLSSCYFNRQCYKPDKLPKALTEVVINNTNGDTSVLHIGPDYSPSFTDTRNKPLTLSYSFESVVFPDQKGNKLVGWFVKPNTIGGPVITVLFLHGSAGSLLSEFPSAIQLAKQGFQVFIADYSGYGFSEGKPKRMTVLADAGDALEVLLKRPEVRGSKVVIYGQSLGAMLGAVTAAANESKIDGLVMEGSPSSYKDIAAYRFRPVGFLARVLIRNGYNPVKAVSHFHKPILVIHSDEDKTAPIFMGRKILDHANPPKLFYEIKHDHIQGPQYYPDVIAERIRGLVN